MLLSILLHFMAFSLVFGVLFIAVCPELNFLPFPSVFPVSLTRLPQVSDKRKPRQRHRKNGGKGGVKGTVRSYRFA